MNNIGNRACLAVSFVSTGCALLSFTKHTVYRTRTFAIAYCAGLIFQVAYRFAIDPRAILPFSGQGQKKVQNNQQRLICRQNIVDSAIMISISPIAIHHPGFRTFLQNKVHSHCMDCFLHGFALGFTATDCIGRIIFTE